MKITLLVSLIISIIFLNQPCYSQSTGKIESVNSVIDGFINVRDFCISADQSEMYFTIQSPSQKLSRIAVMKKKNAGWTEPEFIPYTDESTDMEPFLSPDQLRLYFVSDRAVSDTGKKNFDIWYMTRSNLDSEWNKPVNPGWPINTDGDEFYPSLTSSGNMYFTSERPGGPGKDDIYFSRLQNGKYSVPTALDSNINTAGMEFNAFITKDEKYLIFTKYNSPEGMGSGDLYIASRHTNGSWSAAINMGPGINSKFMEYCPYYDTSAKTLYFTSRRENLENRKFKNPKEFRDYISGTENGLSKIYKVKIDIEAFDKK